MPCTFRLPSHDGRWREIRAQEVEHAELGASLPQKRLVSADLRVSRSPSGRWSVQHPPFAGNFSRARRRSAQRTGGGTCGPREAQRAAVFPRPHEGACVSPKAKTWSVQLAQKPGGGTCSSVIGDLKLARRRKAEPAAPLLTGGGACRLFRPTRRKSAPIPGFRTPYPFPI